MGAAYATATTKHAGAAAQCVDPFHVVKAANEAIDKTRRWVWNVHRSLGTSRARWVKRTRWALLKDPTALKDSQRQVLEELRKERSVLWRAYMLKEELRDLYKLSDPSLAADQLDRWLSWACRSRIPAFVKLSRTIRKEREALRWGLRHTPARLVRKARRNIVRILDGWPTSDQLLVAYRRIALIT